MYERRFLKNVQEIKGMRGAELAYEDFSFGLNSIVGKDSFDILSLIDSQNIKNRLDTWPSDKYIKSLFIQIESERNNVVVDIFRRFLNLTNNDFCMFFGMICNFGVVRIAKMSFLKNCLDLIELNGGEMFLCLFGRREFICVDKVDEVVYGKDDEGEKSIYEITYSREELKFGLEKPSFGK